MKRVSDEIARHFQFTETPSDGTDDPDVCRECGGHRNVVAHEDECYDTGKCVCSGTLYTCDCDQDCT